MGVVLFVTVGLALRYVAGLPAWAAIAIPALALGGLSGLTELAHR